MDWNTASRPDLDVLSALDRPFFAAQYRDGRVHTQGTPRCRLGHHIPRGDRPVDDGIFVHWDWDGERLEVVNDRYGIYPLFYSHQMGGICISPSIHHVLGEDMPRTLDTGALAVFYRLGFFIGEDTPFELVRILPPGSRLTWQDEKLSLIRGSLEAPLPDRPVSSFDEAVTHYGELFAQAIERRPPGQQGFTLPVSGGRDSRHILFELLRQGHQPTRTVTVRMRPPSSNEDIRIARILTEALGLPHEEIDVPTSYFRAHLKDIELTQFCSTHVWPLPVAAHLKGRTNTLYDGLAGSVISGGFQVSEQKLDMFREGRLKELATVLLREAGVESFLHDSLSHDFSAALSDTAAVERLSDELARHQHARNPLVSYIFWNRTRRGVGLIPFALLADIDRVYCPYLDHDVFDFLINLDASYAMGNALHDQAILRGYPEYAHLPFEDKDTPKIAGLDYSAYYRNFILEFVTHLLRHPSSLLSDKVRIPRLMAMLLRDLMRPHCEHSWYVRPMLYTLELERTARE